MGCSFRAEHLHGLGKGHVFDEDKKVDGVALEVAGLPDPVGFADDKVGMFPDLEVVSRHFPEGEAAVLEERGEREFACEADFGFGPGHGIRIGRDPSAVLRVNHGDVASGVG